MSRIFILGLALLASLQVTASDLSLQGFNRRFTLERSADGKLVAIKLKKVVAHFSIMPFINQIAADLRLEQQSFTNKSAAAKEAQIDALLMDLGINPYDKSSDGSEEAEKFKESLMNIPNINIDAAFAELKQTDFWKEFEAKLNEAFLFIDPTVLANPDDARFFYKRQVTYRVVEWALHEAQKRFANIPILNIASFVIVRVHDMMLEQRHFHHNMLLHYFETIPEDKLGMTKEEVDRSVSSIYEYRIDAMNLPESNRAAHDWLNYGMNSFYTQVRAGNTRIRDWQGPLSSMNFKDVKKLDYAFAEVNQDSARKIYHLHITGHMFTQKPALAFDYSKPKKVQQIRSLLNLGGVALGFINLPGWLKSNVDSFIKSFYVEQVRMEGALVGYFESQGDQAMINSIYGQRANFYIVQ